MIKTIIFDNNGVLTTCDNDSTIPKFAEYFEVETEYLRPLFHKLVESADRGEETTEEFFGRLSEKLGKACNPVEIWPIFLKCYQPYPQMRELVQRLGEDYQVALLTNFVDCFDLLNQKVWHYEELFDARNIFVSSKMHMAKPEVSFYKYACEQLKVSPEECVFVDDREANLLTAKTLGMKTILFRTPEQLENELELLLEKANV